MSGDWFYSIDDQQFGPVSSQQLKQLADSGVISSDTLVWTKGMGQWKVATATKGLFEPTTEASPQAIDSQQEAPNAPSLTDSSFPSVVSTRSPRKSPASNSSLLWVAAGGAAVVLALIGIFALSSGTGTSVETKPTSNPSKSSATPTKELIEYESPQLAALAESNETKFKRLVGQRLLISGLVESTLTRKLDSGENTLLRFKGSSTLGVWCDLKTVEPHSEFLVGKGVILEGTCQGLGQQPIGSTGTQRGHVWLKYCTVVSPGPELLAGIARVEKPKSQSDPKPDEYHARLRDPKLRTRAELIRSVERYLSNASILPMSRTPDVPLEEIAKHSSPHWNDETGARWHVRRIESHMTIYETNWQNLFGKATFKPLVGPESEAYIDGMEWTSECNDGSVRFIGSWQKTLGGKGFRVWSAEFHESKANVADVKPSHTQPEKKPASKPLPPEANVVAVKPDRAAPVLTKPAPKATTWEIRPVDGDQTPFKVELRPDGTFGSGKWSRNGNQLVLRWNQGWVDTLTISADGKTAQGSNQHGRRINGRLVDAGSK